MPGARDRPGPEHAAAAERLAELPGVLRTRLERHIREPDDVAMAAEAIRDTLRELNAGSTAGDLRTAGALLQAYTEYAQLLLLHLAALGGELRGLAWAAEIREEVGGRREASER